MSLLPDNNITAIEYVNSSNDHIKVTDSVLGVYFSAYPCENHRSVHIEDFKNENGITAYSAPGMDVVRAHRDAKLAACDWRRTVDVDATMTAQEKSDWDVYRQALRDLPTDQPSATIDTVVWPSEPS